MRTIERSTVFKRDFKHDAKGQHRATLEDGLKAVLWALIKDELIDNKCRNHE